jgi:hypothetical protein
VRDYIGFAMGFAGFGYIVLWLIGVSDRLLVSPALHAAGRMAAIVASVNLLLHAVRRWRRAAAGSDVAPAFLARMPAAIFRPARRNSSRPPPKVKPRNHFGLRGRPH